MSNGPPLTAEAFHAHEQFKSEAEGLLAELEAVFLMAKKRFCCDPNSLQVRNHELKNAIVLAREALAPFWQSGAGIDPPLDPSIE